MRRWVPLGAVVALLGAAMLAAVFANPAVEQLPIQPIDPLPERVPPDDVPSGALATGSPVPYVAPAVLPGWVTWAVSGLCAAVVIAVVAMLVWYFLRDRLPGRRVTVMLSTAALPDPTRTKRRVRDALDEGLAELDDADADPRRAVIACWVRLEEEAAAVGTPREPGDTSTDLVSRLLHSHEVSAGILADFAAVYRLARFAPQHAVDEAMREQARSGLRRLRDELDAGQIAGANVAQPNVAQPHVAEAAAAPRVAP